MAENKDCWGYSEERHPERWIGMFDSREEAIAEAMEELSADVFYIHHGRRPDPLEFFPDADDIAEMAEQRASDEAGEAADEFPDFSKEAGADLDAMLAATFKAWVEKHGITCGFWISDGEPERIDRFAHVSARAHCGNDPAAIGACGGTDETCSCECTTCQDTNG